jgi:uncharacterized protein (TIGR02453 family)
MDWFNREGKRYVASVKDPFMSFVQEVIQQVSAIDPQVRITPREAIFRIHRDTRFSRDKTPYKLQMSAIVSPAGRKDHGTPGMYFELGPEHVAIYGGAYMPEKDHLRRIRERIAAKPARFRALREDKAFVKLFGEVLGERNKVLPKEFRAALEQEPLLANKQFYFRNTLPPGTVTDPRLVDILMEHYRAMRPMNVFLAARV